MNERVGALFFAHQVTEEYAEETHQQIADASTKQELVEAVCQLDLE